MVETDKNPSIWCPVSHLQCPSPSSTITVSALWKSNLAAHTRCSWHGNCDKVVGKKYWVYIRLNNFILFGISKIISTPLVALQDQPDSGARQQVHIFSSIAVDLYSTEDLITREGNLVTLSLSFSTYPSVVQK